ncbi:MAG TPA: hypothetical protein VF257_18265 [Solirubrobacteraceae bacterium]
MTAALSPGRFAAPDATRLGRSVLSHCPGPAVGVRDDDPRRRQHGGVLLDDVILGAWADLAAHHTVSCPVCAGSMAPRYGSGARPVGGRCRRCGSTLG